MTEMAQPEAPPGGPPGGRGRPGSRGSTSAAPTVGHEFTCTTCCRAIKPLAQPDFLRDTKLRLDADVKRLGQTSGSAPAQGDTTRNIKIGHTFWPDQERSLGAVGECGKEPERCHLKGVLVADLERYRSAFSQELRDQLSSVQDMLVSTDVRNLAEKFHEGVGEAHKREAETRNECDRLRSHLEELLRINAQLRQHELLTELDKVRKHSEKLEDDADRITTGGEQIMAGITDLSIMLQPLQNSAGLVERMIEEVGRQVGVSVMGNIVEEVRKNLATEMQPVKSMLNDLKARQKYYDAVETEATKQRKEAKHDITELRKMVQALAEKFGVQVDSDEGQSERAAILKELRELNAMIEKLRVGPSGDEGAPGGGSQKVLTALKCNSVLMTTNAENIGKILDKFEEIGGRTFDCLHTLGDAVENVPVRVTQSISAMESVDEAEARQMKMLLQKLERQVEKLKQDLEKAHAQVKSQTGAPVLRKLLEIEDRGNVRIDYRTGDVEIVNEIPFVVKNPKDEPHGEYKDEDVAKDVLSDVFEIWNLFKVEMHIEGHTKGGEDDFWQKLAESRAALIVDTLEELGADKSLMDSKGLPGKKGLNKVGVVVHMDMFPHRDAPASIAMLTKMKGLNKKH